MRTLTTLLLVFFIAIASFGQIKYEKGYFINNDHQRIECLIKNMDWKFNPVDFTYKLKESGASVKGNLITVREFGITNSSRFVNATVRIDPSNEPAEGAKNELDPVWTRKTLFLRVLLEGKADLYGYEAPKLKRYFYSLNDTAITPLIYKEIQHGSTITKNTGFRQQLWDKLRMPKSSMELIQKVDYTVKDLKQYFKSYNAGFAEPVTELISEAKRSYLNLKLTPGVNTNSEKMTVYGDQGITHDYAFKSKPGFRIGLEAELSIPFDNYKWGILFEPTYQSYTSDAVSDGGTASLTLSSVEFPIGLRYYIYINDNTRLYFNGFYILGLALNMDSKVMIPSTTLGDKTYSVGSTGNVAFGGGLDYKRFSIETRFYSNKDLFKGARFVSSDYSRFSIVLGYRFMEKRLK